MEISFCGSDFGKFEYFHFSHDIYDQIAQDFVKSMCDFFDENNGKTKNVIEEIDQVILKNPSEKKEKETDDSDYSNEEIKENEENIDKTEKNLYYF